VVATTVEVEREGNKVVVVKTMLGGVNVLEKNWGDCAGTSVIRLTGDEGSALDITIVVSDGEGTDGDVYCGI
jgi:hypothetical protein